MKTITVIAVEKGPRPRKRETRRVRIDQAHPRENEVLVIPPETIRAAPAYVDPTLPPYEEFLPPLGRVAGGKIHDIKTRIV